MPAYKLTYFPIRGRAELSRYIFAVAKCEYEDNRIDSTQWAELKPKTPFGHLPILEVDGRILSESNAIARYLAKKFDLAGKDEWENALCDQFIEVCGDLFNEGSKMHWEKDESKKKEMTEKFFGETCKKNMDLLEKALGKLDYLVGNKLSVADLCVFQVYDNLLNIKPDLMNDHPKLKDHRQRVYKRLETYIQSRPQTSI